MNRLPPESDTSRSGPDEMPLGAVIALGGGLTAAFTGAILLIDAYRHRNPGYSCTDVRPDTQALNIDTTFADTVEGSYELWPFGLTCQFPRIGGGMVTVGPDASLTVVLLCFLGAIAITPDSSPSELRGRADGGKPVRSAEGVGDAGMASVGPSALPAALLMLVPDR